jgi:hypothetical protein
MNWFEESFVFNNQHFKPTFWKRYRDDIFLIWDHGISELMSFQNFLNDQEPRIKFTMEVESEIGLPFLDMLIRRTDKGLSTKIYRKPTHTQLYINWQSNHPKSILLGTLKGLIHRAHELIDEKDDLLEEISLLEDVFISNGYPQHLVKKTIKESWSRELAKAIEHNLEEKKETKQHFFDILHAPYVQGFSEILQRSLRKANIGFVPEVGTKMQSLICNPKPISNQNKTKNVIYGIQCSTCSLWYIGETSQRFETRKKQHQGDIRRGNINNAFFCHIQAFPTHCINWDNTIFIESEKNWDRRKFLESIFINALNPSEEIKNLLNIEKGKRIDNCWLEFGKEIREELWKKFKLPQEICC